MLLRLCAVILERSLSVPLLDLSDFMTGRAASWVIIEAFPEHSLRRLETSVQKRCEKHSNLSGYNSEHSGLMV